LTANIYFESATYLHRQKKNEMWCTNSIQRLQKY